MKSRWPSSSSDLSESILLDVSRCIFRGLNLCNASWNIESLWLNIHCNLVKVVI